jgi:hypothetical protein
MAKRPLPLVDVAVPPTVEAARKRLGGRASTSPGVGRIVVLPGWQAPGVVVFAADDECHVLFASGVVRRARAEALAAHAGEAPRELARLADDARVFATLQEGDRVRYERAPGEFAEGTLREKCRFGALVTSGAGKSVAVGFRKLWPVARGDAS